MAAPTKDVAPPAPGAILPAGGKTVGGPGLVNVATDAGSGRVIFMNLTGADMPVCVTVANISDVVLHFGIPGGVTTRVEPGDTKTFCQNLLDLSGSLALRVWHNESTDQPGATAVYRVDLLP